MSKQSEAKEAQGYGKRHCVDCVHYTQSKTILTSPPGDECTTGRKCALGGFSVQAQFTCYSWEAYK